MIKRSDGFVIPMVLALIITFGTLMLVASGVVSTTLGSATFNSNSQRSINIAESGINYYLWHLSHNKDDFQDGNNSPSTPDPELGYGPYEHDYRNIDGDIEGEFTLYIKPSADGSNLTTITSTGKAKSGIGPSRTIKAIIGSPSFSTYSVVSDSELWFGESEIADGPVHSNTGVKMDGVNNSSVTSSNPSYVPSASSGVGSGVEQNGVWCDPAVTSPDCQTRSKQLWRYPVPAVDFNKISADMCDMKKLALDNYANNTCNKKFSRTSSYIPGATNQFNQASGYLITLKANGKYRLDRVSGENDKRSSANLALSTSAIQDEIDIPDSGMIFVEDNVWLDTEASGFDGRVTIVSARLAYTGDTTATIVNNIRYQDKYLGNDVIGLIAENNVDVAPYAPAPLEINAALMAQHGRVQFRPQYNYGFSSATPGYIDPNQSLTFFGSVTSNQQWTWSWLRCSNLNSSNCWSGFKHNQTKYDERLKYNPPPRFPVTSTYDILDWREVITNP